MVRGEQVECDIRSIEGDPEPVSLMIECDPLEILPGRLGKERNGAPCH